MTLLQNHRDPIQSFDFFADLEISCTDAQEEEKLQDAAEGQGTLPCMHVYRMLHNVHILLRYAAMMAGFRFVPAAS